MIDGWCASSRSSLLLFADCRVHRAHRLPSTPDARLSGQSGSTERERSWLCAGSGRTPQQLSLINVQPSRLCGHGELLYFKS